MGYKEFISIDQLLVKAEEQEEERPVHLTKDQVSDWVKEYYKEEEEKEKEKRKKELDELSSIGLTVESTPEPERY